MKAFFLFAGLFLSITSLAQLQRNYASYTVDNGLAQNSVWDVFQDRRGYMWFGTADGVNRFDGYTMHHYKWNSKDSSSLFGNTAFTFFEDSDHNLWVGHNKGISVYNRVKDCFVNLVISSQLTRGHDERYCSVLSEDKKGRVWCISGYHQLVAFSKRDFSVQKRINVSNSNYPLSSIRTSVSAGKYIIGYLMDSSTTWFRLNTETDQVDIIYGPSKRTGYFMLYNDSTICSFDEERIHLYHINQNRFSSQPTHGEMQSANFLGATSLVWWKGKIYLGNNTGLYIFNPENYTFEERITSFSKEEKVGFYYVQSLRVDRSGNLWICTNGDGAKCLSPYRNKFKHYTNRKSGSRLVKCISTDTAKNIYTGMYAEGIIKYSPSGQYEHYRFGKKQDQLTHVLAATWWSNRFWLVNDRYLKTFDVQGWKELSKTDVFHYKNLGYVAYPYFYPYKDKLYLACDINLFEISRNGACQRILRLKELDTLISTFAIINDSTWWIGTTRSLFRFHPGTRKWTRMPVNIYVKCICVSQDKKSIWVAGNSGLFLLNTEGRLLRKFDITDGLPNDFIYGILEDKTGRFWMSHNKGISVYDARTHTFKHYGIKDGLQSNEFNTGAYHKDEDGVLYFGGVNGINVIDPALLDENKNLPQVSINKILLGDQPYKSDTAYNEIKQLELSYRENTLSFDFSALEFSQPEDNTYQYMLEGYNENWIESGKLHFARYANLPPGNYVFKVKAANGDATWNPRPRELYIRIIPPFWQRGWFYVLMVLLGLFLVGTAIYLYTRRQQRKLKKELELQQKLEEERLRISRDLHDHVGAQLSYLITNVEWMLQHPEQLNKTEEKLRLQVLSETGRNAILTLRQTIWALSHKSVSVEDFADRFKQFALKMLEFDQKLQVHFSEDILPGRELAPSAALNIFRICQESFSNCLKHAQCRHIHIRFESNSEALFFFRITDDGIGFDWEQAKHKGHYGLVNMEARAKESGAELWVNASPGNGTELSIRLL